MVCQVLSRCFGHALSLLTASSQSATGNAARDGRQTDWRTPAHPDGSKSAAVPRSPLGKIARHEIVVVRNVGGEQGAQPLDVVAPVAVQLTGHTEPV